MTIASKGLGAVSSKGRGTLLPALFAVTLISTVFRAAPSGADLVPNGKKQVQYCVKFTNLVAFTEKKFLVSYDNSRNSGMGAFAWGAQSGEVGPESCVNIYSVTLGGYDIVLIALPRESLAGERPTVDFNHRPTARIRVERTLRTDGGGLSFSDRIFTNELSSVERVEEHLEVVSVGEAEIVLKHTGRWHVNRDGSIVQASQGVDPNKLVLATVALTSFSLVALRVLGRRRRE